MTRNNYQPYIFVLPEDDANRQIINGFLNRPNLKQHMIQVLKPLGGWQKVLRVFQDIYISTT